MPRISKQSSKHDDYGPVESSSTSCARVEPTPSSG